jgi:hypothetical protein
LFLYTLHRERQLILVDETSYRRDVPVERQGDSPVIEPEVHTLLEVVLTVVVVLQQTRELFELVAAGAEAYTTAHIGLPDKAGIDVDFPLCFLEDVTCFGVVESNFFLLGDEPSLLSCSSLQTACLRWPSQP